MFVFPLKAQSKTVYKIEKVGDASCALCEYVMTQLDNILAKNGTEVCINSCLLTSISMKLILKC